MKKVIAFFLVGSVLTSCSTLYVPSSPVYFNNNDKGDMMFAATLGGFNANVMAGYALTDNVNVGVMASRKDGGSAEVSSGASSTTYEGINGFEPQLILGYNKRITGSHKLELNVGGGPTFANRPAELKQLSSYFIQPSFLWVNPQKKAHSYFSIRGNYVMRTEQFGSVDSTISDVFIEPTFQFNYGNDVKFNILVGYSLAVGTGLNERYSPLMISIGARYQLRKTPVKRTLPNF